ncbi:DUF6503 family protein [Flavobacteriaceae bacterium LMO-SS05]
MKLKLLVFVAIIFMYSCKEKNAKNIEKLEESPNVTLRVYPDHISKVFEAHGGLAVWKQMQTLEFTIPGKNGTEVNRVDLKSRKTLIDMPNHTMGFDGSEVWLYKKDTMAFKGNPKFYYNLMFYFYAMPFVLADDGIHYKDADPLIFEGKTYPGIKISYDSSVGESPDDEYILYYDQVDHKMAFLSYTVTFFSKEKSKEFHFIKYGNWQNINGLLLPESLEWYNVENNIPTTKRNDLKFLDVALTNQKMNSEIFKSPEGAEILE